MKEHITKRVLTLADYISRTKATVREASKVFGVSKSTVHKDVSERLRIIDYDMYKQVKEVLNYNLSERHIRGGIATKEKYANKD